MNGHIKQTRKTIRKTRRIRRQKEKRNSFVKQTKSMPKYVTKNV